MDRTIQGSQIPELTIFGRRRDLLVRRAERRPRQELTPSRRVPGSGTGMPHHVRLDRRNLVPGMTPRAVLYTSGSGDATHKSDKRGDVTSA